MSNNLIEASKDFIKLRGEAFCALEQGRSIEALIQFRQLLKEQPDHLPTLLAKGYVELFYGDLTLAQDHLKEYCAKEKNNSEAWYYKGLAFFTDYINQYQAHQAFLSCWNLKPHKPEMLYEIGYGFLKGVEDRTELAYKCFQKYLDVFPDDMEATFNAGYCAFKQGEIENAGKYFDKLPRCSQKYVIGNILMQDYHRRMGDGKQAMIFLKKNKETIDIIKLCISATCQLI